MLMTKRIGQLGKETIQLPENISQDCGSYRDPNGPLTLYSQQDKESIEQR